MLFGLIAALLCLLKSLRTNQWRWWLALAAAQILSQISHHAAFLPLVALNLLTAVAIMRSPAEPRDRRSHLFRLGLVLSLTTISLSLLYSLSLWRQPRMDFQALLLMAISGDVAGASHSPSWRTAAIWGLLPLCCVAGIYFMFRQDWRTRLAALVLLSAIAITSAVCGEGAVMLAMLLLPLTLAWAGHGAARAFPHNRRLVHTPLMLAAVFAITTAPVLQRTMDLPRQPVKDVVQAATRESDRQNSVLTFTFGRDALGAIAYDPGAGFSPGISFLSRLVDFAFEKNRPLFVYHTLRDGRDPGFAEIMKELQTSGRFHLVKEFPASDPARSYLLYRYQPREQIIRLNVKPEKK